MPAPKGVLPPACHPIPKRRKYLVNAADDRRWLRLWGVLWCSIFERGKRPDLPTGCPERTDWQLFKFIWRFDRVTWPRIDAARIEHGAAVPTYWLRSRREISEFLGAIPPPGHT